MPNQEQPNSINRDRDEFDQDLNPNPMAGQNTGPEANQPGRFERTAKDIDKLQQLEDFSNDELKQIPILKSGTRLQQGATYINLNDPNREEFTGVGDMSVDDNSLIVPKDRVGYLIWNRLIGVER
ncbi:hypothetical protein [Pleurocapsa sp. FMAR1]|uniref:hypothetical protein n=1 Tax=Pleurocapsa sp. FMAR1 TaxID=3040204 RepID=UPI0029C70113|nr:hypothetical protein [Pleurocapsa sp. FMAR1]